MARSPVTRVQLDAYRFGQRRLESALARRDPVLLHEEIRGQRRVVLVGLVLAMLALVANFALTKLAPKPAWQAQQVVVGKQSGRMFAVIHQPDRLVPVDNLAAARLVRYAAQRGAGSATATPVPVDDADLDSAPRTAQAALHGAQAVLPTEETAPDEGPSGPWALCDTGDASSTVLVAGPAPANQLGAGDGLLLADPSGRQYLVLGGRKHRIEGRQVLRAYDLVDQRFRPAAAALLGAIPSGRELSAPVVPGAGKDSSVLPGRAVGDVVRVVRAGQPERFYLVLADGVQDVGEPVANLVRAALGADPTQPPDSVRAEQINALPRVAVPGLADYPAAIPRFVSGPAASTICWQWAPSGLGGGVLAAPAPPLPGGRVATRLAQADGAGPLLDEVSVPAGHALVGCAVSVGTDCSARRLDQAGQRGTGALWLVSETGVGYPIANDETATALGVRSWTPVPAEALRALPAGPVLDVAQARRTVDVLMAAGGS
jgi:type VII secretion protein EccB